MQLSVVIPVFNEESNIPKLISLLTPVLESIVNTYEIIFVNDGSIDSSLIVLIKARKKNKRIKIISFSRNFGHMAAVEAGLSNSQGQRVVLMDADLQDPPRLISKLYKKSLAGYDVVYAIKKKRREGIFVNMLFRLYYRILNNVASHPMPLDAGTFSIMSRRVVDVINTLPERNKYFSGLRSWAGFTQTGIDYTRPKRFSGKPASVGRLIKLGLDGLISFSYLPLRLASFLGFLIALFAFIFIIFVILARFLFGLGIIGWASTMSTILLIGGIQLITLGIIGEYLGRIYEEVKKRPNYLISEKIGFQKKGDTRF